MILRVRMIQIISFFISILSNSIYSTEIDSHLYPNLKEVEFLKLSDTPENLSGITFNPKRQTYLMLLDDPHIIYETDVQMNPKRKVEIIGMKDPEDILFLEQNENKANAANIALVDEIGVISICPLHNDADRLLISDCDQINFSESVKSIVEVSNKYIGSYIFETSFYRNLNKGPEGLTYDPKERTFYVVKESKPAKLLSIKRDPPFTVQEVYSSFIDQRLKRHATDFSSIYFNPKNDLLYILSHESHCILLVTKKGKLHSKITLKDPSQHEGITRAPDGRLIIVSEPHYYQYIEELNQ